MPFIMSADGVSCKEEIMDMKNIKGERITKIDAATGKLVTAQEVYYTDVERVPALPLVPSPPYLKRDGVWKRSPAGSFWVDDHLQVWSSNE